LILCSKFKIGVLKKGQVVTKLRVHCICFIDFVMI
jgi:hypothetical protein